MLKINTGPSYVWKTAPFTSPITFPAGVWTANLWLSTSGNYTQYRLSLSINRSTGNFTIGQVLSPSVDSSVASAYVIQVPVAQAVVAAGDYIAFALLNQGQQGGYTSVGNILFDSAATLSTLTSPGSAAPIAATTQFQTSSTTAALSTQEQKPGTSQLTRILTTTAQKSISTTTTRRVAAVQALAPSNPGIALAIIIGLGAAAAAGALALGLYARRPRVVSYGRNYYCKKHKLPLTFRNGAFWCPRERKFLKR
jgi:hypothetical protein